MATYLDSLNKMVQTLKAQAQIEQSLRSTTVGTAQPDDELQTGPDWDLSNQARQAIRGVAQQINAGRFPNNSLHLRLSVRDQAILLQDDSLIRLGVITVNEQTKRSMLNIRKLMYLQPPSIAQLGRQGTLLYKEVQQIDQELQHHEQEWKDRTTAGASA